MSTDQHDDVRALLRSVEPGRVPTFDVDAIMLQAAGARRRQQAERWLAVAAVAALLVAVGVVLAQVAQRDAAPPVAPTPTSSAGFRPKPLTADQWLQFSQVSVDESTSVHAVSTVQGIVTDMELVPGGGQGTVTAKGVTSRCLIVGDETYLEPQVLVALGDTASKAVPAGTWVRMPKTERFATLCSATRSNPGGGWGHGPVFGPDGVVDGQPVKTVSFDVTGMMEGARTMTYYLQAEAPYLPLRVTLDGTEIGRLGSWNSVTAAAPTAPPASSVVDLPPRA